MSKKHFELLLDLTQTAFSRPAVLAPSVNHKKVSMRTVNRGANPFAPIAKQRNQALTTPRNGVYEHLEDRVNTLLSDSDVKAKIESQVDELKKRLNGEVYQQDHFGKLLLIPLHLLDINIDIQRDLVGPHIADNIIARFDPRILQPVNVTFIHETGRYSAWDGQQSSATLKILLDYGVIDPSVMIQCKVVDDDLVVPGSTLVGEAYGNFGFRTLNSSREPIDAFWMHRSRVSGVRNYGSTLTEDLQANEIQKIFEKNHMFPAKSSEAQGQRARPGMVTHISGCNNIAGHGTRDDLFAVTKRDLDRALAFHDRYFSNEKGVDSGFILAFGRLYAEAREQDIDITAEAEQDLYQMMVEMYGNPRGFHADCKQRLNEFQKSNKLKTSWSDSCLTPILVLDYLKWSKSKNFALPAVNHMTSYAGI